MVKSLMILVIEDNEDDAILMIHHLIQAGYEVSWERVETAEELEFALKKPGWNLVLCDYVLPRFNGLEALSIVHKKDPDIPFIIVTGAISEETAVAAVKAGANDYVLKSNLIRLVPAIEHELEEATTRRLRKLSEEALAWEIKINQSIAKLSSSLVSPVAIEAISELVLQEVMSFTGSTMGCVGYCDPASGHLIISAYSPKMQKNHVLKTERTIFKKFEEICSWVLHNGKPVLSNDLAKNSIDSSFLPDHAFIHRLLSVPALIDRNLAGQIAVANSTRAYDERDLDFAERLAQLYAIAVKRKHTEDALQREYDIINSVMNTSPVGIMMLNEKGQIIVSNVKAEQLLGKSKDDYINRINKETGWKFYDIDGNPVADSDLPWNKVLTTGKPLYNFNQIVEHEDGRRVFLSFNAAPLADNSGKIIAVVCTLEDITDRKKLEDQLIEAQKMEALARLAGGIAHDFNNILTTIIGNAELILMKLPPEDPLYNRIKIMHESAERAAHISEQLLTFSRKKPHEPVILNLNETIPFMHNMLKQILGEDIEYHCLLDENLKNIKADPRQIEQVILNLIVNARDAMPRGGTLTIATKNESLQEPDVKIDSVDLLPCGEYVELSVSDTGTGISQDILSKIYEPFFTTKEKGTGLGLSIIYGIVKKLGGNIYAHSEIGKGSTFTLYLPIAKKEVEKSESSISPNKETKSSIGKTILVVEDEPHILELVDNILSPLGHKLLLASNASEALSIAHQSSSAIDLLLTDIIIPGKAGPEIASEVKSLFPNLKILYITGYSDDRFSENEFFDSKIQIISKPFHSATLAQKVREILEN